MTDYCVSGFRVSGLASGIKPGGEKDLGLIVSDSPAAVAGVFTRNQFQAAPVILNRERLSSGRCRAVVVNSGVANCCTGKEGMQDAIATTQMVAQQLNIEPGQVLVASTGVIGPRLPMDLIGAAIVDLVASLQPDGFPDFARSIMTTDTVPKLVTRTDQLNENAFTITGVAKGSGMIHPDMATMLAFICTDLAIDTNTLQSILTSGVDESFNRIIIDGDTRTNDMVFLLANGRSKATIQTPKDSVLCRDAIHAVMATLARQLVKDGEGASKLVTIAVKGAESEVAAKAVAATVAKSALVKTAFFGEDANWGRIVAAVGRAGVAIEPERVRIYFEDTLVFAQGTGTTEAALKQIDDVLKQDEFAITIDLGVGISTTSVLTCDLSVDYVRINADYRT